MEDITAAKVKTETEEPAPVETLPVQAEESSKEVPMRTQIHSTDIRLIDYIWVRDLTAPVHLGLINRPFVPHVKITGAL
jgi:hypothetical protein